MPAEKVWAMSAISAIAALAAERIWYLTFLTPLLENLFRALFRRAFMTVADFLVKWSLLAGALFQPFDVAIMCAGCS